ncbi:LysE family translocator [Thalassospira lucentensis]|uniref:LysE family translocator n=1 Tax=Thalassospira lucentensis TaxID=168935 RepID=UPI0004110590|nr:LysE family translocator [Thalassospira lucentensis]
MTYAENLWLFFILLSGIIIVPGMDMFFVIANSLTGGKRAGLSATAGIMLGGVYHTLLGAIGISALLAIAPWLLNVMLFVGAAYMVWIGITLLRSAITVDRIRAAKTASLWIAFRQGMITCIQERHSGNMNHFAEIGMLPGKEKTEERSGATVEDFDAAGEHSGPARRVWFWRSLAALQRLNDAPHRPARRALPKRTPKAKQNDPYFRDDALIPKPTCSFSPSIRNSSAPITARFGHRPLSWAS